MARLDPTYDVIDVRTYGSDRRPEPSPFAPDPTPPGLRKTSRLRLPPPPTRAQLDLWNAVRQEVMQEVSRTPTPVVDALGPIRADAPPSQGIFGDTRKRIEDTYNWKTSAGDYLSRTAALPAGGNWNGGYGLNAFSALKTLEKQLNFFRLNGMTPLEAAVQRYNARAVAAEGGAGGAAGEGGRRTRKHRKMKRVSRKGKTYRK